MHSLSLAALMLLVSINVFASESGGVPAAIAWLEIVDSGEYTASWEKAAPFFREQISIKQWERGLKGARASFGKLLSREINEFSYHTSLPGVPDGDYMTITMATTFEHKADATETVIVSEADNEWQVIGYFIK